MSAPRDPKPLASTTPAAALVREGWRRLRAQSPQAAWAAWQEALRLDPENDAARQALERLAAAADLPAAARRIYRFRSPTPEARATWDARLRSTNGADVNAARRAFEAIVADRPADSDAWFNLGLCRAWSDQNADAVDALARSVHRDAAGDSPHHREIAADAWSLAEIVRHGAGAESLSDDIRCTLTLDWPDTLGDPLEILDRLGPRRVLAGSAAAELDDAPTPPGLVEWLDRPMPIAGESEDLDPSTLPQVRATMTEAPGVVVFHALSAESLLSLEHQIAYLLGPRFRPLDRRTTPLPLHLLDTAAWQFRLPEVLSPQRRAELSRRAVEHWYQHAWIHSPRIGLASTPDAADAPARSPRAAARDWTNGVDPAARDQLEGVIRVREELARRPAIAALAGPIDFDALRRRLGLEPPREIGPGAGTPPVVALDPTSMSCDDLFTTWREAVDPAVAARHAEHLARRFPARLVEKNFRPIADEVLRSAVEQDGPDAAHAWLDHWSDTADNDHARAFVERLRTEVALAAFGDEQSAAERLANLARGPSDDPDLLERAASTLSELGDHEHATLALRRALAAAERADDLPHAARLWHALGRPFRDTLQT